MGTPGYMAPEQAVSGEVDGRADLYSLGVMLYEMVSGAKPFTGGVLSLIHHHLSTPPPPLIEQLPAGALSPGEEAVVMKLLAKLPADRYADAGALVAAIDAELGVPPDLVGAHAATRASSASAAHAAVSASALPTRASSASAAHAAVSASALPSPPPAAAGRPGLPSWARVGGPVLLLVLAIGIGAAVRSRPRSGAVRRPAPPGTAAARQPELLAPDAQLAPALLAGASALELLSSQFPQDPRLLHSLAVAYAAQKNYAAAARTVGRLLPLMPDASTDAELTHIVATAALGSPEALSAALEVLEGPMGDRGVQLLMDLSNRITTKTGKAHLAASLAKPAVRAHALPATLLVLDLRAATRCDTRHALLARAKQVGDSRALGLLRPLDRRDGCGFLNLQDCWPCLRQDWALRDAMLAIEARQAHPSAPTPPTSTH